VFVSVLRELFRHLFSETKKYEYADFSLGFVYISKHSNQEPPEYNHKSKHSYNCNWDRRIRNIDLSVDLRVQLLPSLFDWGN
jgi:hypothetical protein